MPRALLPPQNASGGSVLGVTPFEIPEGRARVIIDGHLKTPGAITRRGPNTALGTLPYTTDNHLPLGMVAQINPYTDALAMLVLDRASSTGVRLSGLESTASGNASIGFASVVSNRPVLQSAPSASGAGMVLSVRQGYRVSDAAAIRMLWNGSIKAEYTTGTVNAIARGDRTINFSGSTLTTNVEAGMFLMVRNAQSVYQTVGTIKAVNSNTQVTLEKGARISAAGGTAYKIVPVRGLEYYVSKGRVTTSTSSTTVTGQNTRFKSQCVGTVTNWYLFRYSDFAYVGAVSSITNEASLTLTGNAAIAMDKERYVLIEAGNSGNTRASTDAKNSGDPYGTIPALYAGRQWFINWEDSAKTNFVGTTPQRATAWFTEESDPEAIDITVGSGDSFVIGGAVTGSDPVIAAQGLDNALVLFKANEVWTITGDSPANFTPRRLLDDGVLHPNMIAAYKGGLVWAGKRGIWFYDGASAPENLVADTLGQAYMSAVRSFNLYVNDLTTSYGNLVVYDDHAFVWVSEGWGVAGYQPDQVELTPDVLLLNLTNGGVTFLTNMNLEAACLLPRFAPGSEVSSPGVWIARDTAATTVQRLYLLQTVFETNHASNSTDTAMLTGNDDTFYAAPNLVIETRPHTLGGSQKAKWRELILRYESYPTADVNVYLNRSIPVDDAAVGTSSLITFPATALVSSEVVPERERKFFDFRASELVLRIWAPSGTSRHARIYDWQLAAIPTRERRL